MESQRPSIPTHSVMPSPSAASRVPAPSEPSPSKPGPLSSFARFVVCGGGVGLLSSAAVPMLAAAMPWALANALITVVSTLLCTELHALFTFGTGRRPGLRQHLQSSGSAGAAYLATTAAMLVLHAVQPSPTLLWEQAVYLTASGLAGVGRFLVLRLFVFAERKKQAAPARIASARNEATPAHLASARIASARNASAPKSLAQTGPARMIPAQALGALPVNPLSVNALTTGPHRPAYSPMAPSVV